LRPLNLKCGASAPDSSPVQPVLSGVLYQAIWYFIYICPKHIDLIPKPTLPHNVLRRSGRPLFGDSKSSSGVHLLESLRDLSLYDRVFSRGSSLRAGRMFIHLTISPQQSCIRSWRHTRCGRLAPHRNQHALNPSQRPIPRRLLSSRCNTSQGLVSHSKPAFRRPRHRATATTRHRPASQSNPSRRFRDSSACGAGRPDN
jgi:hypothetical protein